MDKKYGKMESMKEEMAETHEKGSAFIKKPGKTKVEKVSPSAMERLKKGC